MKLIRTGAEAKLYKTRFEGKTALLKERVKKGYRNSFLDERIRKQRTKGEACLLRKARAVGVRTPAVYKVGEGSCSILMEFIEGKRVKDVLDENNLEMCIEIGKAVGKMHSAGIVHGDLTTSNIMQNGKALVFIDFGLARYSRKIEDMAVDLLVFRKTFEATHCNLMPEGWNKVIEGYIGSTGQGDAVLNQIGKVEKRARYH